MAALLARDPANQMDVGICGDTGLGRLIETLHEAGANDQVNVLAVRLNAIGAFHGYRHLVGWDRFPFGREPDTTPAAPWTWDDLVEDP